MKHFEILMHLESGVHDNLEETTRYSEGGLIETSIKKLSSYNAEYRTWYGTKERPRWCPKQSKFLARGGDHQGVDIQYRKGTQLKAFAKGSIQWNPKGAGGKWGNHIFLNYSKAGQNYTFVYAHLDSLIGIADRTVEVNEFIATSGCTGNTVYCGSMNVCNGYEDHLHLELFGPNGRMDPIR